MKKILSILFILPMLSSCSYGQVHKKYANLITESTSKAHLTVLASPAFEGRGTGQAGGKKAADYIAEQFKQYGLKTITADNSYFQPVSLIRTGYQVDYFKIGQEDYAFGKDFFVTADNNFSDINATDIVFVGYGLQDDKYNELKNVDVKDKIILLINEGEPYDTQGNSLLTQSKQQSEWSSSRFKRIQALLRLKPKMILATGPGAQKMINQGSDRNVTGRISLDDGKDYDNRRPMQPIPVVHILEATADKILAKGNSSLAAFVKNAAQGPQAALQIPVTVNSKMGIRIDRIFDPNVLGMIEGSDRKNEYVIVSGHYDHDGILPNGVIFPGADDNASGTVAVLELARVFAKAKADGNGPRRSLIFIALAAEEKGLLGSQYYVENPLVPLENTVVNMNIDMIGRIDDIHLKTGDPNYIHAIGLDKLSSELQSITEKVNAEHTKLKLDYTYNDPNEPMKLYYRSDHYNFAKKGIPAAFFFSGLHPDYHTPNDTVDKIEFPLMVKREKLIFYTLWEIANRDKKIVVDSNKK